jgi:hypothetical protein
MREKAQVLDEFWIKIIAFLTMTLDHVGMFLTLYNANPSALYTTGFVFRIVGRLAFPLFAFMLAEGMHYSKKRGDYVFKLFILWAFIAVIDTIIYSIYRSGNNGFIGQMGANLSEQAFTDLLLYTLFIYLLEHKNKKLHLLALLPLGFLIASYTCNVLDNYGFLTGLYFPYYLRAGYSIYGFLIFLGFYYSYKLADSFLNKNKETLPMSVDSYKLTKEYRSLINIIGISIFAIVAVLFWGLSYIAPQADVYETPDMHIQNYCLIDCFILVLYNGKRGYDSKTFRIGSYIYYPVHLAIIALIFSLIY